MMRDLLLDLQANDPCKQKTSTEKIRRKQKMSDGKVRAKVHLIEETKTYGQKGFRKRLVVLEQEKGRFENFIPIEFIQDDCDSVDELKVGDEIEVSYRLSGRRWQKDSQSEAKFFLNLEAVDFQIMGAGSSGGSKPNAAAPPANANDAFSEAASVDEEDIPF